MSNLASKSDIEFPLKSWWAERTSWVEKALDETLPEAGDYHGSLASLEDEFLPPFKAFQVVRKRVFLRAILY